MHRSPHSSTHVTTQLLRLLVAAVVVATTLVGIVAAAPAGARSVPDDGRISLTSGSRDRIDQCPVRRLDDHLVRCDHLTGGDAVAPSWLPTL